MSRRRWCLSLFFAYTSQQAGTVELKRCRMDSPLDHFVSVHPDCEFQVTEHTLGWVYP